MHKKSYFLLAGISASILLFLFLLHRSAPLINQKLNGFTRNILPVKVTSVNRSATKAPLDKIVGLTHHTIFFSVPNPQWVISMTMSLKDCDTLGYGLNFSNNYLGSNNLIVDSPEVLFFAHNVPAFFLSNWSDKKIKAYPLPATITRSDRISSGSIILRSIDSTLQHQRIQKLDFISGKILKENEIITGQQNGGFENDGWLKYDAKTNRIYFVEYYRNRFYCLDTNLNILYTSQTIDTVHHNKTIIKKATENGVVKLMPASPRIQINLHCFISNGLLYVNSALKADNESFDDFLNHTTFDVYVLKTGRYFGSFYVSKDANKKLKSFAIMDSLMIMLYNDRIATNSFSLPAIPSAF